MQTASPKRLGLQCAPNLVPENVSPAAPLTNARYAKNRLGSCWAISTVNGLSPCRATMREGPSGHLMGARTGNLEAVVGVIARKTNNFQ